jgi:hypothetical protein
MKHSVDYLMNRRDENPIEKAHHNVHTRAEGDAATTRRPVLGEGRQKERPSSLSLSLPVPTRPCIASGATHSTNPCPALLT